MESAGTIDIRIDTLAELFDPLDPSPLHGRALAPDVRLLIHRPASVRAHGAEMADGIHEHFRRTHEWGERQFRRRLRLAHVSANYLWQGC